ncbi:MAG TPA: biotin--[acetyl-CoA-carboxylase] ligase [Armatimonadota bacterium]|nr:biotin--[acetyl-CoA-carboxylase] ligase [Armatimonadota bacterium]HOP79211.1 biotin--[acetyl-CoA-carboxylase] ligase [Armatimonadota bacterium]
MIGTTIHRFEKVESTNDIAKKLAEEGASEGTVVVASEQTKGRGSRGRVWLSPPGANLLVSVIFRPNLPPERMGELAFVASVAVAGTLRDCCGLEPRIKWPNDVQVDGLKISGIIVEAAKGAAILGVGINVNWTELPEEITSTATSIALEVGRPVDMEIVLKAFLADLDIVYNVYRARGFGRILQDWRDLETTTGRPVTVSMNGGKIQGTAVDVDEHGSLIVEMPDGSRKAIPAATLVH